MRNAKKGVWIKASAVRVRTVNGKPVLDIATGPPTRRNTEGFKDARGVFHPIRSGDDYDPEDVGERWAYAPAKKKKKAAARRRR